VSEKTEIGARLREEALAKFGSIKALADAVEKTPQYLNVYLSGINAPGPKVRRLLQKAGLDVAYIMTGRRGESAAGSEDETNKVLEVMREKGIKTVEELRGRLEREEMVRRLLGADAYSAFIEAAVVREKQAQYEGKKKKRR
jgi:hypothetical protein